MMVRLICSFRRNCFAAMLFTGWMVLTDSISVYGQHKNSGQPLSKAINTEYDELMPRISPDGKSFYFVRAFHPDNIGGTEHGQNIWVSEKQSNGEWMQAKRLGEPLNSVYYNYVGGFGDGGKTLYLGNVYNKHIGTVLPGISVSNLTDSGWTFPVVLVDHKFLNSGEGSFTFCINPEFNVMFTGFACKGGNHDLFFSELIDGKWTRPRSLGSGINTKGQEICPFLSPDGQYIFFSSDGRGGIGSYDIFYSRRTGDSWDSWETPVNAGSGINSPGFDGYFATDPNNETAYYYSGNSANALGDIYSIPVSELGLEIGPSVADTEMVTLADSVESGGDTGGEASDTAVVVIEPVDTVPVAVVTEPVDTVPVAVVTEPVDTVPVVVVTEPVDTVPVVIVTEPVDTVPVVIVTEPVDTVPVVVVTEPVDTVPVVVVTEPVDTVPVVVVTEPVDTVPVVVFTDPVDTVPVVVVIEPVDTVPVAVPEILVAFDTLRLQAKQNETVLSQIPGIGDMTVSENISSLDSRGKPGRLDLHQNLRSLKFIPDRDFSGICKFETLLHFNERKDLILRLFVEVEVSVPATVVTSEPETIVVIPETVWVEQKQSSNDTLKVSGRIIDLETGLPVPATVTFYEKVVNQERAVAEAGSQPGDWKTRLQSGKLYNLLADFPGFYTYGQNLDLRNGAGTAGDLEIHLARAPARKTVTLPLVNFNHNSAQLDTNSWSTLRILASYLRANPGMKVEISGHTDYSGAEVYNAGLSLERANAVIKWLIADGIEKSRLRGKGYGESRPMRSNLTEAGKSQNRRVEVEFFAN